jgi:hypothetical protein
LCPVCRGNNLHHGATTVFERRNGEDGPSFATIVNGKEIKRVEGSPAESANPSPRRNAVAIEFRCEGCPAISELTIMQHKGTTYLQWQSAGCYLEDGESW